MMNKNYRLIGIAVMAAAMLGVDGCRKAPKPPKPVAVEQAPATLQEAFKDATPEAQKMARDAVAAVQAKNYAQALTILKVLSSRSDLTAQQRDIASRSMLAVNQALAEQAGQGNQKARKALQYQRMNK